MSIREGQPCGCGSRLPRHALYDGNGISVPKTIIKKDATTRMKQINFENPFSWFGAPDAPSIQTAPERHRSGIYLWAVALPEGYLTYYVGMTMVSFAKRMGKHHDDYINARYRLYEPQAFAHGRKEMIWSGHWYGKRPSKAVCKENAPRLREPTLKQLAVFRYLLAPLSYDQRTVERIEAAIAYGITGPGARGAFQEDDIRYCSRKPHEEPIKCVISSSVPIIGLPTTIVV
jgi:hypothetical protein